MVLIMFLHVDRSGTMVAVEFIVWSNSDKASMPTSCFLHFTHHGCSYNVIIADYAGISSSNPSRPTTSAFDETTP